jgi:hypothetical protein
MAVYGPACATDVGPQPAGRDNAAEFHRLLIAAKANPGGTDWPALRAAYAASATYDPYAGSTPEAAATEAALQRLDFRLAATIADQALRQDWMDLRAQFAAAAAEKQLGNASQAAAHQQAATGSLHAVMATGDGASTGTAFHVLAASEEYLVVQSLQLHAHGKRLQQVSGHWYDVLTVSRTPGSPRAELYFNVDTPLARETSLNGSEGMTGGRPTTDDQLP